VEIQEGFLQNPSDDTHTHNHGNTINTGSVTKPGKRLCH